MFKLLFILSLISLSLQAPCGVDKNCSCPGGAVKICGAKGCGPYVPVANSVKCSTAALGTPEGGKAKNCVCLKKSKRRALAPAKEISVPTGSFDIKQCLSSLGKCGSKVLKKCEGKLGCAVKEALLGGCTSEVQNCFTAKAVYKLAGVKSTKRRLLSARRLGKTFRCSAAPFPHTCCMNGTQNSDACNMCLMINVFRQSVCKCPGKC